MSIRIFEDETERIWIVSWVNGRISVRGKREINTSMYDIARSCAQKLGITLSASGIVFERIKDHRLIWKAIWEKGRAVD